MLRILNLQAGYGALRVLKGVSLHIAPGEMVAVIGANGAGKSTLMKAIAGILRPQAGGIFFNNEPVGGIGAEKIVARGCCLVPEGRHVFSNLSVRDNLILGAYARRKRRGKQPSTAKGVDEVFEMFPILRQKAHQPAGSLSGGQQQMLAIGRALMSRPALLMLDEPSLGVAPLVVQELYQTFVRLKKDGMTILLVEQNVRLALEVADRGYVIETGQVVLEGTSWQLADNPEVRRAYLGKEYKRIEEDENNDSAKPTKFAP